MTIPNGNRAQTLKPTRYASGGSWFRPLSLSFGPEVFSSDIWLSTMYIYRRRAMIMERTAIGVTTRPTLAGCVRLAGYRRPLIIGSPCSRLSWAYSETQTVHLILGSLQRSSRSLLLPWHSTPFNVHYRHVFCSVSPRGWPDLRFAC